MAKTDICIDLETLATSTDAAILTIGAVRFDPYDAAASFEQKDLFSAKIDLDSCTDLNLTVHESTIDWWATQSKEAQEAAFSSTGRIDIQEAFNQLYKFCWGCKRVWSNGAGFDIVICETVFNRLNRSPPWRYFQVRDCRTIYDLGINPELPKVTAHNALEDAIAQTIGIQTVFKKLKSS